MTGKLRLSDLDDRSGGNGIEGAAPVLKSVGRLGLVALSGLLLANCANNQVAGRKSKEIGAFPSAKYGPASPRVVAEGEDVPKGGGRQMIGKSYSVAGKRYTPFDKDVGHTQVGTASWYGEAFHGRRTANGEVYDRHGISAAHPTMPLPAYARVTNVLNSRSIIVRVNDRGPFHGNRAMDVSQKTADALAFRHLGTARVKIEYLGQASLNGSDDKLLLATLRTDGVPASIPGTSSRTMVASTTAVAPARSAPADLDDEPAPRQPAVQQAEPVRQIQPQPAVVASAAALQPVPVRGAPVPPARPFDLDTIAGAATPVVLRGPVTAPPARPASSMASLFAAPEKAPSARFGSANPLATKVVAQQLQPLARP